MPTPRTKRRRQCRLASPQPEPRRKGSGVAARPSVRRPAGAIELERTAAPATGGEPRRRSGLPAVRRSPRSVRCASPRGYVRATSAANAADRHPPRSFPRATSLLLRATSERPRFSDPQIVRPAAATLSQRPAQYSFLITKKLPRIVPASFDFCRANLKRDSSSAGTSIPSESLKPTARFSGPYSTLTDRPLS